MDPPHPHLRRVMVVLGRPKSGRGAGGDPPLLILAGGGAKRRERRRDVGWSPAPNSYAWKPNLVGRSTRPYDKYKPIVEPAKCQKCKKCSKRNVRQAYHNVCTGCSKCCTSVKQLVGSYGLSAVMEKRRLRLGKAVYQDLDGEAELDEQVLRLAFSAIALAASNSLPSHLALHLLHGDAAPMDRHPCYDRAP
ncbi:hypothetical protein ZWY2020_059713 [Hordeum vulgare]|nr:hypothetical protein ZWY2020_059713 [Hordeum vulgare]